MKVQERTATEQRRTQAAPVDLEHGALEAGRVVELWLVVLAALGVASVGGLLAAWGWNAWGSLWPWLAGAGAWLFWLGLGVGLVSLSTAGAVLVLAGRGMYQHQLRVERWDAAQLAAYKQNGGQETHREYTERTLTTAQPMHVLAVALAVAELVRTEGGTPWSGPQLVGPVRLGNVKLGELGKREAEEMGRALAEMGVITGRGKGTAGQLVTTDPQQLVQLVTRNYGRYVPGRVDRAEAGG